jgi:hypothetical protein
MRVLFGLMMMRLSRADDSVAESILVVACLGVFTDHQVAAVDCLGVINTHQVVVVDHQGVVSHQGAAEQQR